MIDDLDLLIKRLCRRLQIRYGVQDKVGIVHAMVDYDDLRAAISALEASRDTQADLRQAAQVIENIAHPPYGLGFNKLRGLARAYQERARK